MPSFWLEYDNNGQVQEFNFDGDSVSVGRDKSSEFVLDHPTVSRQHAVIARKNGGFYLVVLSRGGMTAIDGQQVQGEVMLHDGSMIHLGQLQFRFRSNHAPPKPSGGQRQAGQNQFGGMPNAQNPQNQQGSPVGGFAQSAAASFGSPGAPNGQGPQNAQSGQGGGGLGDSPSSGTFGPPAQQGQAGGAGQPGGKPPSGEPPPAEQPGRDEDGGIISWDEIASSSEATGDGGGYTKQPTVAERMQAKKGKDTNPALVAVAGAAIVGLLYFTFFTGGAKKAGPNQEDTPIEDQAPVTLEINCMGESACVQRAKESYKVGMEKLEKKGAAVANLFEGYKKLLETEKYLEKAGKSEPLPSMDKLVAQKEQAREELTDIFKNERVKYHQAKKRNLHRPMAQALDAVKIYFPDKTAREHRWALAEEMDMKRKGIYPKHVYPQR